MFQPHYGGDYLLEKWSISKFRSFDGGHYELTLLVFSTKVVDIFDTKPIRGISNKIVSSTFVSYRRKTLQAIILSFTRKLARGSDLPSPGSSPEDQTLLHQEARQKIGPSFTRKLTRGSDPPSPESSPEDPNSVTRKLTRGSDPPSPGSSPEDRTLLHQEARQRIGPSFTRKLARGSDPPSPAWYQPAGKRGHI